ASRLLKADLGVGPYLLDLLPNKMMEYLLLGIPAIAADWPTMRRYFGPDAVTYVRPNDVDALVDAIRSLYLDPERRRVQAASAREQYLNTLAWSKTRYDYLSVYGVPGVKSEQNGHSRSSVSTPLARSATPATAESGGPTEPASDAGGTKKRRGWLGFVLGQSRGPRNALSRLPTIVERFGIGP